MRVPNVEKLIQGLNEINHILADINKYESSIFILSTLRQQITKILSSLEEIKPKKAFPTEQIKQKIRFILSHIEGLCCELQFIKGKTFLTQESIIANLTRLVKEIAAECRLTKPRRNNSAKEINFENIDKVKNYSQSSSYKQELQKQYELYTEQAHFNSLLKPASVQKQTIPERRFEQFLTAIWNYALQQGKTSKTVFISHAWPIDGVQALSYEKWIMPLTVELVRHLIRAGITVYMDYYHSGAGNALMDFMNLVGVVDRVIVFNSQTWAYKMSLSMSGILTETQNIIDSLKSPQLADKEQFLTIISLVNENYCQTYFQKYSGCKQIPTISLCDKSYLEGLKLLLIKLYEFDNNAFEPEWNRLLNQYQISQDWWSVQSYDACYIDEQNRLADLSNSLQKSHIVVIQGESGVGKTQLATHYIYQQGYAYEAIYWFTASDTESLKKMYFDFAQAKKITADKNTVVTNVSKWLAERKNCLLIYDVKEAVILDGFLPSCSKNSNKVIILSRQQIPSITQNNEIILKGFNKKEGEQYLQAKLGLTLIQQERKAAGGLLDLLLREKDPILPKLLMLACGAITRKIELYPIQKFVSACQINPIEYIQQKGLPLLGRHEFMPMVLPKTVLHARQAIHTPLSKEYEAYYYELIGWIEIVWQICHQGRNNQFDRIFNKLLSSSKLNSQGEFLYRLKVLLTHFEAILHLLPDSLPFPLVLQAVRRYVVLWKTQLLKPEHVEVSTVNHDKEAIHQVADDKQIEKARAAEQQIFDASDACESFLKSLWLYALQEQGKATKKVYIIFANPNESEQQWTTGFAARLVRHLQCAGIQVYGREQLGTAGSLDNLFHQVDHVLLVSSKALNNQAKTNVDIQFLEAHVKKKQKEKFILPILLSKANYCPKSKKGLVAHGFCSHDHYLDTLQSLIQLLYDFDHAEFGDYCQRKKLKYKIAANQIYQWNTMPFEEKDLNKIIVRKPLLEKIKEKVQGSRGNPIWLLANGMGGVGKTTLAAYYVYKKHHQYTAVFWFTAGRRQQLEGQYVAYAKAHGLLSEAEEKLPTNELAKIIKNRLEETPGNCLFIYDDASNDPEETIEDLAVVSNRHTVMITSRHKAWTAQHIAIDMEGYLEEEAIEYVTKQLGSEFVKKEIDLIKRFIERLDRLPLALELACAYLTKVIEKGEEPSKAIEQFLKEVGEKSSESKTLAYIDRIFAITFEKMAKESAASITLLNICAFVYKQNIPYIYFAQALDSGQCGDALRVAKEYSMIKCNEANQTVSLHGVVQEVIILKLQNEAVKTLRQSTLTLKTIYPYQKDIDFADIELIKQLYSHIDSIIRHLVKYQQDEQLKQAAPVITEITIRQGDAYAKLADYVKAKEIYERVLKKNPTEKAYVECCLAEVYGNLGLFEKQITLLEELKESVESNKEEDKSRILLNLGKAYSQYDKPWTAIEHLFETLQNSEKYFLSNPSKLRVLYQSLGSSYTKLEQHYAAKVILKKRYRLIPISSLHYPSYRT